MSYHTADVQTLLVAFLNMTLTAACFTDEVFFLAKSKNFQSWVYFPQVLDY